MSVINFPSRLAVSKEKPEELHEAHGVIVKSLIREDAIKAVEGAEAFLWVTHSAEEIRDIFAAKSEYAAEHC